MLKKVIFVFLLSFILQFLKFTVCIIVTAKEMNLIHEVCPHDELIDRAQAKAEQWIKDKKIRSFIEQKCVQEYKDVNMKESHALADAFLATPFLGKKC